MSIASKLTKLDGLRGDLADNLMTMGVTASDLEALDVLIPKVLTIETGGDPDANLISFIETGAPDAYSVETSVTIPSGATKIGPMAFATWIFMSSINIDNVTEIGEMAFYQCSSLDINLPDGLTKIGQSAFWACSLTNGALPSGLLEVGGYAFASCSSLVRAWIPNTVTTVGTMIFLNLNPSLFEIYCEAASKPAGWDAAWDSNGSTSLTVHWSTTKAAFDAL